MPARVEIQISATGAEAATSAFRQMAVEVNSIGGTLRRVFEIASGVNLANLFDAGVRAAADFGRELVTLGLQVQRQEDAFKRLTASVGVNGQALEAALEKASRGIADISDVMTTSAQALQEGLQPEQLVKVMEIATEQSKLMGTTVVDAFNQITTAILRQQERGLKSAGIYLDLTEVFAAYAQKLGTTADRLTEAARTQAIFEAVSAKTTGTLAALSSAELTNAQAVEKLGTAWTNVKERMGSFLVDTGASIVRWAGSVAEGFAAAGKSIDAFALRLPIIGDAMRRAQALQTGSLGEAGPGMATIENLGTVPAAPLIKPPDPKELERAAKALQGFREEMIKLAVTDETAKALLSIREKVADLSHEFPALAPQLAVIGTAMEALTVDARRNADALKDLADVWQTITNPSEGGLAPALAFGAFDAAMAASTDLSQTYRRTLQDVTFTLGGVGQATVDIVDVLNQEKEIVEDLLGPFTQLGPILTTDQRAFLDFQAAMEQAGLKAAALGQDFDLSGARISALRSELDVLVREAHGEFTPEIQRVGEELRAALADQALYDSIQEGFLTVTDTFSKMADGLIQGTLNIADAFKNLGQSLLTNFVQLVLHQVFDPILKEAASFVSGLIGLLTGRGGAGLVGTAASALGLLAGGSSFAGLDTSTYLYPEFGGTNIAGGGGGGGGGTLGTLGSVGSLLSTAYSVVAKLAGLPSTLDLLGSAASYLGSVAGSLYAGIQTGTLSIPAAFGFGAGAGAGAGGASSALGATGGITGSALGGASLVMLVPALAGFLDSLGRDQIRWNNIQKFRATTGFTGDVLTRQEAFAGGASLDTIKNDLAILLGAIQAPGANLRAGIAQNVATTRDMYGEGGAVQTLEQQAAEQNAILDRFVQQVTALGIVEQDFVDLGQGMNDALGAVNDSLSVIQGYTELLANPNRGAGAGPAFDRQAVIDELMADIPRIALILDLPSLAKEGEDTAQTFQRMVTALSGLQDLMGTLDAKVHVLRGDLPLPALLATELGKLTKQIDAATIALNTTQDPEKMLAAAQDLGDLIERRYQMETAAVLDLIDLLDRQASALALGYRALAQAGPTLRSLGVTLQATTPFMADLVRSLGEVGDTAGQVGLLGAQVASFVGDTTGATAETILSLGGALSGSLSDTLANVEQMTDAQARMAALTEVLGAVTQGYEAGAAALHAYYEGQRAAENTLFQSRMDALTTEQAAIDAQRTALEAQLQSSREWSAVAITIRDAVTALQIGPASPLNPADQLAIVRAKFEDVLQQFWANPSADLAQRLVQVGNDVITTGLEVFSRPSPEFQAIFNSVVDSLAKVAAEAESRVTPEEQAVEQLAELNRRSADVQARIDALNVEHAAKLDAITSQEQVSLAALQGSFHDVAAALAGNTDATWRASQVIWGQVQAGTSATYGAIWQTAGWLAQEIASTKDQIVTLTQGTPIDQYMQGKADQMAASLDLLHTTIRFSLEELVGRRLDTLIQAGGPQAVIDALKGPMDLTAENTRLTVGWLESLVRGSFRGDVPYRSFQEGTWSAPGGPSILHPGEVVVPAAVSAAEWLRQGGFAPTGGRSEAPTSVTFAPGSIVINGATDPRATARAIAQEVEQRLLDKGVIRGRRS